MVPVIQRQKRRGGGSVAVALQGVVPVSAVGAERGRQGQGRPQVDGKNPDLVNPSARLGGDRDSAQIIVVWPCRLGATQKRSRLPRTGHMRFTVVDGGAWDSPEHRASWRRRQEATSQPEGETSEEMCPPCRTSEQGWHTCSSELRGPTTEATAVVPTDCRRTLARVERQLDARRVPLSQRGGSSAGKTGTRSRRAGRLTFPLVSGSVIGPG
jgi:hypothetical protein